MFKHSTWDERYQAGTQAALPWDTGAAAPELVEFFQEDHAAPKRALEIGCGTGTNAIWMARQGVTVVATDISPTAIDVAKKKCKEEKVQVDFQVSDILEKSPVSPGSVEFVFDRGVFHVMAPEQREIFVDRIAAALSKDGFWLCLAGNADEVRGEEDEGPPQLKAIDLLNSIEGKFELYRMERTSFILPNGIARLAWKALFKKRPLG